MRTSRSLMAGHHGIQFREANGVPSHVEGRHSMCYVYILRCVDGSFYVGHTGDLDGRVSDHNKGRGSTYTSTRRPVRLMYSETFHSEAEAIRREHQLKRWSAAKKQSLILGDLQSLKRLSRTHS